MEEEYRREENFERAYADLDEKDKEHRDPNLPIEDKELKKRIAKICLKLIEKTPNDKTSIMETSYMITGSFIWFNYGDDLDEAVGIAGELELPEQYVSGDVLQMWEEMKNKFKKYLS